MSARKKLKALLRSLVATQAEVMAAYDAGILEEHGKTCSMASPAYRGGGVLIGDNWYCYCPRGAELVKASKEGRS